MLIKLLSYKKALKFVKTIILVLASAVLAKLVNFAEYFSFFPDEQTFNLSFTIYLASLDLFYSEYIEKQLLSKIVKIDLNLSDLPSNATKDETTFTFNEFDITYIQGYLDLKAPSKRLKEIKIKIIFPTWVTIQNNKKDDDDIIEIDVENHNICYLNIGELVSVETDEIQNKTFNFKLAAIKSESKKNVDRKENVNCQLLDSSLKINNKLVEFISNKSYIQS